MKSSNADTSVIYTPKGGLERGSQSESEISNDGRKNYFLWNSSLFVSFRTLSSKIAAS